MAANLSGGGFSSYFWMPAFQRSEVLKYLELYPEFYEGLYKCARCQAHCRDLVLSLLCTLCSRLGRGYPDISAQAIDYEIIVNGEVLYANGTTCAVSVCFPYSLLLLLYVVHIPSQS